MQAEVDQSGKIEWTQKPTVVALSNGIHSSVMISAKDKRYLLKELARRQPARNRTMHRLLVFATLLFILLKENINRLDQIVVEDEYQGHSPTIKEHILNLFRRHKKEVDPQKIIFRRIGKSSPAHDLAITVFRGKSLPSRKLKAAEVLTEFRK